MSYLGCYYEGVFFGVVVFCLLSSAGLYVWYLYYQLSL
jgi:hypothetical protein